MCIRDSNDAIFSLASVSEDISDSMQEMESGAGSIEEQCAVLKDDTANMDEIIGSLEHVAEPVAQVKQAIDAATKTMGQMSEDPFLAIKNEELLAELKQL